MNNSTIIENFKRLNNIMYSPKNYDFETGDFNIISHNNHIDILANIILSDKIYNDKDIVEMANKYDEEHIHIDEKKAFGKKWLFDNTSNYEMKHHRQIIFEEFFCSYAEIKDILGFNPHLINYLINIFMKNNLMLEKNKIFINNDSVNKQIEKILALLVVNIENLKKLDKSKIIYTIQDHPIIKIGNIYLLSSVYIIESNCRRILNYRLKEIESFKKHKGDKFEDLVFDIVKHYFDGKVYKNVEYTGGETDIVAENDSDIYVIECKAIDIYDDFTRNIDNEIIENNINDILKKTEEQGSNFFSALCSNKKIKENNVEIIIDKKKKKHIIGISLGCLYGLKVESNYDYINLSFSDFATILSLTFYCNNRSYYKKPFKLINDMFNLSVNVDPIRTFWILLNYDYNVLEIFKEIAPKTEAMISLKGIQKYDSYILKLLYDYQNSLYNKSILYQKKDWMHKYLTREKISNRINMNMNNS